MAEPYTSPTSETRDNPYESWNNNQLAGVMLRLLDPQYLAERRTRLAQQEMDSTFDGRYVAGQLLGAMEANPTSLALRSSDPEVGDIVWAIETSPTLTERYFFPVREMDRYADWAKRISIQAFEEDPPLELPLANFVSAEGMQDWFTGRGDVVKIEESTGVSRSSSETIQEYASRETEAPPIESVVGYVQPIGIVLFATAQGSHRTAAAIARGDHTIKTKSLTLMPLNENFLA